MKKFFYITFGIIIVTGLTLSVLFGFLEIVKSELGQKVSKGIRPTPELILDVRSNKLTLENVYDEIMENEIKFSEIVLRQCIIETGWLTSYNCLERHNLFGMTGGVKDSNNVHGYKVFDHWTKSVHDYKEWQERNYGDSDLEYYSFLESIGYAESTEYISKLKSIKLIIVKN